MFKRGSVAWLVWNLVLATIILGFGIANLINNNVPEYQYVIILILGIVIVTDAAFRLLLNIITIINLGKRNLIIDTRGHAVLASFELAVGISTIHLARLINADITQADFLFRFLGDFIGIAAIVCGVLALAYTIIMIVKKAAQPIDMGLGIVGSIVSVTAGILVLIYLTNENVLRAFFILFGVIGVVFGTMLILGTLVLYFRARKMKKALQAHLDSASEEENQADVIEQ
ncbi:MAG: hypothetical protein IJU64_02895 [Bacilli bacterium]|nr:hypothetical protein [Bacilli bacterium]